MSRLGKAALWQVKCVAFCQQRIPFRKIQKSNTDSSFIIPAGMTMVRLGLCVCVRRGRGANGALELGGELPMLLTLEMIIGQQ